MVYAALLALVCARLHAFVLAAQPRARSRCRRKVTPRRQPNCYRRRACLSFSWRRPSRLTPSCHPDSSAHLLAIFSRAGIDAGTVVWIGALFGPAQVGARLIEFAFGKDLHPLWVVRFALGTLLCAFVMLAVFGVSVPVAAAFALMFGGANGLVTITRGAVPLALFGASGYGRLMGRLAAPFLFCAGGGAFGDGFCRRSRVGLCRASALARGFAAAALICFLVIRRPA